MMAPKDPDARKVAAAVARLVLAGAALTLRSVGMPLPVTFVRQLDRRRWFFWEAGGDTEFDGHIFAADSVETDRERGIVIFTNDGALVGQLEPLSIAFADPDAARREARWVERCQRTFVPQSREYRFVLRQFRAMGAAPS